MNVRVRLAPSPTGPLHVGTARTALFNLLFARHHGGQFLLRVEDTDRERSKPEYEQELTEGLRWLGIIWDEGPDTGGPHAPYRQSERIPRYRAALDQLLREGKARLDNEAVLLKVVPEEILVNDLVRGEVRFPASEQQDFVIARGLDDPLFHLAVVVDDAAMGITHVIRGEDHLSNTPKHMLLQRALGLPTPAYAHVPLLLDAQRRKLSKRTAETGLLSYRDEGYLPEAMVNFLALLGWNPKTEAEMFVLEDLVERFDLGGIQKGGAVFDRRKLDWLQREHGRQLPLGALVELATPFLERAGVRAAVRDTIERSLEVWRERGGTLSQFVETMRFCFEEPSLVVAELKWKEATTEVTGKALDFGISLLENLSAETWTDKETLYGVVLKAVDEAGKGPNALPWLQHNHRATVLWPMRYAVTGRRESPGFFEVGWILGREETLRRVDRARAVLGASALRRGGGLP